MSEVETCSNCKFFRRTGDREACHRYPPSYVPYEWQFNPNLRFDPAFGRDKIDRYIMADMKLLTPMVDKSNWCGEYIKK
jgi:hypothetical protein